MVPANVYKGRQEALSASRCRRSICARPCRPRPARTSSSRSRSPAADSGRQGQDRPYQGDPARADQGRHPARRFQRDIAHRDPEGQCPALTAKGEPVGVKVDGGILEHIMWELQVECLPTDIPEKIEVDVSEPQDRGFDLCEEYCCAGGSEDI